MSQNRAVASAQKRRNAPMEYPPQQPKGPNTSIHSSQVFSQQPQQGSIPGKGMKPQQYQQQSVDNSPKVSQMTIPQAITLITLRLGKVESQLQRLNLEKPDYDESFLESTTENASFVDKSLIQSIISRLESLEKRGTGTSSTGLNSNTDVQNLKSQLEALKPIVSATKNLSVTQKKEIVDLKNEVESLKNVISNLQQQTDETTQKVITLETAYALNNDLSLDNLELGENETDTDLSVINDISEEVQNSLMDMAALNQDNSLEIHDNTLHLDLGN